MRLEQADEYLTKKIEDAGFVVLGRGVSVNQDALTLMIGSKEDGRRCVLAVTAQEAMDFADLLDCRLEQSLTLLRNLAA